MRVLIWIIVLFAIAIALAIGANIYAGNVYIVINQILYRINLHVFVIGLIIFVVLLYIVLRLLIGILNIPSRMQKFGLNRKSRKATTALNNAGLAFFEGKFQQAEQQVAKVLANKEAGNNRMLALMLGAHAADQMDDIPLRNQYLKEIESLPAKQQLSRYLLLAESALNHQDYSTAETNLAAASKLNQNLTRLIRLQLRYAFDHGDAKDVLDKTEKLLKTKAISEYEAEHYRNWAYTRLLTLATDDNSLKACLKQIPEQQKIGELCAFIAKKYEHLGLYEQVIKWVSQYYPQTHQAELLEPFAHSVQYLDDKAQQRAIDTANEWLKLQPNNASLLMCLGQLAYNKKLWGKAQSYLEASIALEPSIKAHLALAKVFDETHESAKAEQERMKALKDIIHHHNESSS